MFNSWTVKAKQTQLSMYKEQGSALHYHVMFMYFMLCLWDEIIPLTWSRRREWWSQQGRKWLRTLGRSGRVAEVCWAGPRRGGGVTRMDPALHSYCCHLASLPVCGGVCVCSATAMPRNLSFRVKCLFRCIEWIWIWSSLGVEIMDWQKEKKWEIQKRWRDN